MQIKVRAVYDIETGRLEECDVIEYSGPLALCDRSDSKKVTNQSLDTSAQNQANAQAALASTNAAVADYSKNVNNYMKFGRQTYGANGTFMKDQNTLANSTAAAGTTALGGDLAMRAMRTGENTAGYATGAAEARRTASRDLTTQLAGADATRLQQLNAINQYGVDASKYPSQVYSQIYGTGSGNAVGALNPASNSAKTPGFIDQLTGQLIQGGATVGAAAIK